jgi:hypothetical protein
MSVNREKKIKEMLNKLIDLGQAPMRGTVLEVDEATFTCNVQPENGDTIYIGVLYFLNTDEAMSNKVVMTPALNAECIFIPMSKEVAYLVFANNYSKTSIEINGNKIVIEGNSITINDGNLGGLVKVNDLVSRLNNIEQAFNELLVKLTAHVHADSTPSPVLSVLTPISVTSKNMIENTKIKQ